MRRFALVLSMLLAGAAGSQEPVRVRIGSPNMSANGTVTAAVTVTNAGADTLRVVPRVQLPADWRLLTGSGAVAIEPGTTGLMMVGVAMPSRAPAGPYQVTVQILDAAGQRLLGLDTLGVVVPARRAVELSLLERPNFVVSGRSYDARFLLRNRGNAPARVVLTASSSFGTAVVGDSSVLLAADASRTVRVRVQTRTGLEAASDDVLEVAAADVDSGATRAAEASARVTVVPEPDRSIDEYLRVPMRVNLRAANSDAVSRFEAFGQGPVRDGSDLHVDFLARGPTGRFSAFGERDEYRVALTAPAWRVRAGDQTYMLSALTGSGQPGFGVGVDADRGPLSGGVYGQDFRRAPEKGSETGAFVSVSPRADTRLSANAIERAGGALPGRIASASATVQRAGISADLEVAGSSDRGRSGRARSARVSGGFSSVTYDFGHLVADTGFAGSQRGARHNYLIARAQPLDVLALGFSGSLHRVDLSRSVGLPYEDRLAAAALSATVFDRLMVEAGRTERGAVIQGLGAMSAQHSLRTRADQDAGPATLSLEVEAGRARDPLATVRDFTDVTLAARHTASRGQVGAYAQRYSGGSVIKGTEGTITLGGDASLQLGGSARATLFAYTTRQRVPGADWHSQLDALITRALRNDATVTLRARLLGGGSMARADQSVVFLEYGMPLRVPVSRLRTPGRVHGRIVDAVTGRGIAGALVRLGPQVAITDRDGDVAFGAVPAGEHRLSMSQETSFANAVFVDDPTVQIDGTRTSPTTFRIAVARSARVDIAVRRFTAVRTAIGGAADSLADAGAVANATLVLAGERDTLFRTTGEDGRTTFTDIPPGRWTITVRGDAPAFHRFDPDRADVELEPGEARTLSFRLVPRKRDVQIIGDSQDLKAAPAEVKARPGPGTVTKTVKPDDQQQPDRPELLR